MDFPGQLWAEVSILAVTVGADIADTAVDSAAGDSVLFATRDAHADAASVLATVTFVKDVAYFLTSSAVAHMAQESVSKLRNHRTSSRVHQSVRILGYSCTILAILVAAVCPALLFLSGVMGVPASSLDTALLLAASVFPMTCSRLMEQWIIALGLDEAVVGVAMLASLGKVMAFVLLYWHSGAGSASIAVLLAELLACAGTAACLWWALTHGDSAPEEEESEKQLDSKAEEGSSSEEASMGMLRRVLLQIMRGEAPSSGVNWSELGSMLSVAAGGATEGLLHMISFYWLYWAAMLGGAGSVLALRVVEGWVYPVLSMTVDAMDTVGSRMASRWARASSTRLVTTATVLLHLLLTGSVMVAVFVLGDELVSAPFTTGADALHELQPIIPGMPYSELLVQLALLTSMADCVRLCLLVEQRVQCEGMLASSMLNTLLVAVSGPAFALLSRYLLWGQAWPDMQSVMLVRLAASVAAAALLDMSLSGNSLAPTASSEQLASKKHME